MRWRYKLPLRLRSLFHRNEAEMDLSEELQFHLQNQIDESVAQGMDPQEARHAAFRSLGGVEQVKEECRDARRVDFIGSFLLADLRFALRTLQESVPKCGLFRSRIPTSDRPRSCAQSAGYRKVMAGICRSGRYLPADTARKPN